jgi:hypothetical protein
LLAAEQMFGHGQGGFGLADPDGPTSRTAPNGCCGSAQAGLRGAEDFRDLFDGGVLTANTQLRLSARANTPPAASRSTLPSGTPVQSETTWQSHPG